MDGEGVSLLGPVNGCYIISSLTVKNGIGTGVSKVDLRFKNRHRSCKIIEQKNLRKSNS